MMAAKRRMNRQTGKSLILETRPSGDDKKKGAAAFSRFVLPFRWQASAAGKASIDPKGSGHYETTGPIDIARKKYFTRETANVLFERAQWLQLSEWGKSDWAKGVKVHLPNGLLVTVALDRPRMVLFEWGPKNDEPSPLHTGFLLLDLYFPKPNDYDYKPILDDMLAINDIFRYIDCPYDTHYYNPESKYSFVGLFNGTPLSFLTENEEVHVLSNATEHSKKPIPPETRLNHYFNRWAELLTLPVTIDNKTYHLVSEDEVKRAKRYLLGEEDKEPSLLVYADNRAYVWSAASLIEGVSGLKNHYRNGSNDAHDYGHWIKLLNVDGPGYIPTKTHSQVRRFERDWARERTYGRWEESGTWYGFTYHSGVMLAQSTTTENKHGRHEPNIYISHFADMYFDIAILLFYLRVSLFRFSNELSVVAKRGVMNPSIYDDFRKLRKEFATFTILYQFPILSNQEQAIEMYQLARKHFDIEFFYKEVKDEILETHEFLEMEGSKKLAKAATWLAWWGLPLATAGLSVGVLSLMSAEIGVNHLHIWDCVANYSLDACTVRNEAWVLLGATFVLTISLAFVGLALWKVGACVGPKLRRVGAWIGEAVRRICPERVQG